MKKTIFYTVLAVLAFMGSAVYFSACKQDPCVTRAVECMNGGTCKDGDCLCTVGYEGDSCQHKVNKKFNSPYACIRTRITGTLNQDDDDTLIMKAKSDNFGVQFYSIRDSIHEVFDGTVSANSLNIPEQTKDSVTKYATYKGSGSLNNGVLTITLFRNWTDSLINYSSKTTYVGYKYE